MTLVRRVIKIKHHYSCKASDGVQGLLGSLSEAALLIRRFIAGLTNDLQRDVDVMRPSFRRLNANHDLL